MNMDKKQFIQKAGLSGKPTVVDFWAPWCAPCRRTKPILEKLAKEYQGSVNFWAINSDEHQNLIQELKIFGIPTILLIQNGKITGRFTGVQREAAYRKIFESLSTGQIVQVPISPLDRLLRLGIGATSVIFALHYSAWWLLALGMVILFTGVYDRCPIWQAISRYLKNTKKTP